MTTGKPATRRIHRQTLIEMNRAAFTARRDAAHERARAILENDVDKGTREQRADWYLDCLRLMEDALRSTLRSQIAQDGPLIQYLKLVRETLKALLALVNHEINLAQEAQELSRLLGPETVARLLASDKPFSDSERSVLDAIHSLLGFGEPLRARDTKERQRSFEEDDRRRFRVAQDEFTRLFSTYGR
ncbi:MAG: hypothetical protein GX595_00525 [Lentisphaerae bacterium]|nr:hypothetical protein [Lentisphaerota bacterium]